MKKIMAILVLTLLVVSACKKDDSPKSDKEKLVGTWEPVKYVISCEGEGEVVDFPDECESNSRLTFKADGTGTFKRYYLNSLSNECYSNPFEDFDWQINDGNLTIAYHIGNEVVMDYFKVTNSTLKLGGEDGSSGCLVYIEYSKQ
jgi:hypothetical protein